MKHILEIFWTTTVFLVTVSFHQVLVATLQTPPPASGATQTLTVEKPDSGGGADGVVDDDEVDQPGPRLGEPVRFEYRVAAKIVATAQARQILVTLPVPQDWPEQSVVTVTEDVPPATEKMEIRELKLAPRQMVATLPSLASGESAIFSLTFDVEIRPILPPADPDQYSRPEKLERDMKHWLDESPGIESRDSRVKTAVRKALEGVAEDDATVSDWDKIAKIRDWILANIEPASEDNRDTGVTLKYLKGTERNRTRLFIAMCRASKIPARMVWCDGNEHAEFYLEHSSGEGFWFPCRMSPAIEMGANPNPAVVQQKGDHFRVPEKKEELEFVSGFIYARSTSQPQFGYVEGQVRK